MLPQSFGRFKGNLMLRGVVCDDCNHLFGSTIELYLARDTPDGLNRYLIGGKDPEEFKSLGKNSSLVTRADSGPLKGALVAQRVVDGKLGAAPLQQVALGKTDGGPYDKWFTVDVGKPICVSALAPCARGSGDASPAAGCSVPEGHVKRTCPSRKPRRDVGQASGRESRRG